jgi:hypothetical protein
MRALSLPIVGCFALENRSAKARYVGANELYSKCIWGESQNISAAVDAMLLILKIWWMGFFLVGSAGSSRTSSSIEDVEYWAIQVH